MRLILLGTLRGLIIQPTRDIFSAKPLTTNLNFLRSESSMNKALTTPYVCFANAFIANAPQRYKKSVRINTLQAVSCIKLKFQSNYATIMTENIRQYVKSIMHDTGNRVNDDMKCVGKGLQHEYYIIHYLKTAETAFHALLHTEWFRKRCFCVQTQRSK